MKKHTLGELGVIMSQADVLRLRMAEAESQIGHKKHLIDENEKAIKKAESLALVNKNLLAQINEIQIQIGNDAGQLNEFFEILKDNGVPVPDSLKSHTVVHV